MSKQHIPTAFPSDTKLLNFLQESTTAGNLWVCRPAVVAGVLIHETTPADSERLVRESYPTVRRAIAAAMGVKIEPSAGR